MWDSLARWWRVEVALWICYWNALEHDSVLTGWRPVVRWLFSVAGCTRTAISYDGPDDSRGEGQIRGDRNCNLCTLLPKLGRAVV
jgi:hypothetical protein